MSEDIKVDTGFPENDPEVTDWSWSAVPSTGGDVDVAVVRRTSGTTYVRIAQNALVTVLVAVSPNGDTEILYQGSILKQNARVLVADHERRLIDRDRQRFHFDVPPGRHSYSWYFKEPAKVVGVRLASSGAGRILGFSINGLPLNLGEFGVAMVQLPGFSFGRTIPVPTGAALTFDFMNDSSTPTRVICSVQSIPRAPTLPSTNL